MKIKDLPIHQRPREKLIEKGVENLKNAELLAILLRTGRSGQNVIEIAEKILSTFPMKSLLNLSYRDLLKVKGIDIVKACTLLAGFELTKRALEMYDTTLPFINDSKDALHHLSDIKEHKKEFFIVLYLNARNQLVHKEIISIGTLNASLVHPREVFEPALRVSAAQVILAHNHPSGETEPSDADLHITKRLIDAGKLLGINVIDHIIITKNNFRSLKEFLLHE